MPTFSTIAWSRVFLLLLVWAFCRTSAVAEEPLRVVYFSKDIPAVDPLSPAFDPDSYAVIPQIFDSLVHLDLDGQFRPALATRWERTSSTTWEFYLRQGVKFHNGEPFNGKAVKFTYEAAIDPKRKAGNAWILASIQKIWVDPGDPFHIAIQTRFPDAMFLNRLSLFGSVCPPQYIAEVGWEEFARRPVGTGPYRFVRWERQQQIELKRNSSYWDPALPKIDRLHFVIIPKDQWVESFLRGEIDFLPNLAGSETALLMHGAKGKAKILKRQVLAGYWVMLKNEGPLANKKLRQALNLALNKEALVDYADFGNAEPLASLGKSGEFGANPRLKPYPYDVEAAKALLQESGVETPMTLKVIVADIAESVAKIMKHDFAQLGIELDMEVVPRAEWADKVVGFKIRTGRPADYDLAINLVDNPIYNLAFHAGLFLHSESPWALLNDAEFDRRYLDALQAADAEQHRVRLEALDAFIHEEALMVFTTQRVITAAVREGVRIPKFGLNGHLDYYVLSTAEYDE